MNDAKNIDVLIEESAELIRPYSAELADCFIDQPWRRKDLIYAFEKGFKGNAPAWIDTLYMVADLYSKTVEYDEKYQK